MGGFTLQLMTLLVLALLVADSTLISAQSPTGPTSLKLAPKKPSGNPPGTTTNTSSKDKVLIINTTVGVLDVFPSPSPSGSSGSSSSKAYLNHILNDLQYQNSSKPFSERFGKTPRISSVFHYPVLPDVYWKSHKRPYVPWIDPTLYPDFDVASNVV